MSCIFGRYLNPLLICRRVSEFLIRYKSLKVKRHLNQILRTGQVIKKGNMKRTIANSKRFLLMTKANANKITPDVSANLF